MKYLHTEANMHDVLFCSRIYTDFAADFWT